MKWTENDILVGRFVCKEPAIQFSPSGWAAKWTHKIGYIVDEKEGAKYVLLAMTDGLVGIPRTKADMVAYLNSQGMIPMPIAWLQQIMATLENCYGPAPLPKTCIPPEEEI